MIIKYLFRKHTITATAVGYFANLVFFLSRKIYKRNLPDGLTLIIALHKLGDTVFTLPAIKAVIEKSKTKFIILCFEESETLYKIIFSKNQNITYYTFDRSDMLWEGRIVPKRIRKTLHKKYKIRTILDLTGGIVSARIIINARVTSIVGCSEEFYKSLYDLFAPLRKTPHLMDMYIDSVKLLDRSLDAEKLKYFPPRYNPLDPLLIHPYAGWEAKEWGIQKFIELAVNLSSIHKVKIILPKEKFDDDLRKIFSDNKIETILTNTIEELATVLRNCSLLISNDSGPIQIASLLGKPTFTIFGPTNPLFAIPFGEHHKFIYKKIGCSPGLNEQYCFTDAGRNGCPSFECMKRLKVEEVFLAVKNFLVTIKVLNTQSLEVMH